MRPSYEGKTQNSVSVVIPAYNGGRFIGETLRSLAEQSSPAHEIIVVDDGSTDATVSVVREMAETQPVKLIQQANAGTQAARNTGLAAASGEYVLFLDQDDLLLPDALAELGSVAQAGRVVYANLVTFGEKEEPRRPNPQMLEWPFMLAGSQLVLAACLLPVEKVRAVGGFDPQFLAAGDWELTLRLKLMGVEFYHLDKTVARYRLHEGNTSKNLRLMISNHRGIVAKTLARPDLPTVVERYRTRLQAFDHVYSAIRLWQLAKGTPSAEVLAECRDELTAARRLYGDISLARLAATLLLQFCDDYQQGQQVTAIVAQVWGNSRAAQSVAALTLARFALKHPQHRLHLPSLILPALPALTSPALLKDIGLSVAGRDFWQR